MLRRAVAQGVVLIVILGIVGTMAPSAVAHEFHLESAPAVLTGDGGGEALRLEIGSSTLLCNQDKFEGTLPVAGFFNEYDEITVRPTHSECSIESVGAVSVKTNDCATVFDSDTSILGDAPVRIECAAGSSIEVVIPGICTLKIGAQTPGNGVHYANLGSGTSRRITATTTITGISYTKTGAFCFLFSGEANLTGGVNFFAYEDKGSPQANPTTPSGTSEGFQRALFVE